MYAADNNLKFLPFLFCSLKTKGIEQFGFAYIHSSPDEWKTHKSRRFGIQCQRPTRDDSVGWLWGASFTYSKRAGSCAGAAPGSNSRRRTSMSSPFLLHFTSADRSDARIQRRGSDLEYISSARAKWTGWVWFTASLQHPSFRSVWWQTIIWGGLPVVYGGQPVRVRKLSSSYASRLHKQRSRRQDRSPKTSNPGCWLLSSNTARVSWWRSHTTDRW